MTVPDEDAAEGPPGLGPTPLEKNRAMPEIEPCEECRPDPGLTPG